MSTLSARFEDILDRCIADFREDEKSLEDCLAQYPAERERLEPLLRVTTRLEAAGALVAPTAYRRIAAHRMKNLVASQTRAVAQVPFSSFLLRRKPSFLPASDYSRRMVLTSVLAVVLIVSLLFSGMVYASGMSLPGDLLYPAKVRLEEAQLAASRTDLKTGELNLVFASRRLEEADRLVERKQISGLDLTLSEYQQALEAAVSTLAAEKDFTPEEQARFASLLAERLDQYELNLNSLLARVPVDQREAVSRALLASLLNRQRVLQILAGQTGSPAERPLPALLKSLTPGSDANQPAIPTGLVTLLPTRPAEPRPALTGTPTANNPAITWPSGTPSGTPSGAPTGAWPTDWPTGWPTNSWPTDWPGSNWPTDWPTGSWPTNWPTDWPTGNWPTSWPTGVWPTGWPSITGPTEWVVPAGTPRPRPTRVAPPGQRPHPTARPTTWNGGP